LACGSIGARGSEIGCALHHQIPAMKASAIPRNTNGGRRREIGDPFQTKRVDTRS
jgi:hypothetical protein